MYGKLILRSARRSVQDYLIYLVTLTLCVGLFYAFLSISSRYYHPALGAEFDLSFLSEWMKLAICGVTLLLLFLIRYVNRYMIRQKQQEFAMQTILGMEQRPPPGCSLARRSSWDCSPWGWESRWAASSPSSSPLCSCPAMASLFSSPGPFSRIPPPSLCFFSP